MIQVKVDIDEAFLKNMYGNNGANDFVHRVNTSESNSFVGNDSSKIESDLSEMTKAINSLSSIVQNLSQNVVTKDNVEEVVSKVVTRELENKIMTEDKVLEILNKKLSTLSVDVSQNGIVDIKKELEEFKINLKTELINELKDTNTSDINSIDIESLKQELITELKGSQVYSSETSIDIESIKTDLKSEIEEEYKKKVKELEDLHQKKVSEMSQLHMSQMNQFQMSMMNQMNVMNQLNPQFPPTQVFGSESGVVVKIEEKNEVRTAPTKDVKRKLSSMMDV